MRGNLVAFTAAPMGFDRPRVPRRGTAHEAEAVAAEAVCCIICGCPGGPCTFSVEDLAVRRGSDCPLIVGRSDRTPATVSVDPELFSLTMASLFLLGSVVWATI